MKGVATKFQNVNGTYRYSSRNYATQLGSVITHLLSSPLRPSMQVQYQHHVQACYDFVTQDLGQIWVLPLRVEWVASFLAHLFKSGNSYATILTYVSALSYQHTIRGI